MFQYLLLLESEEERKFFAAIYEKYRTEMFYTAYRILHNPPDAEDMVHETFLSLINHIEKLMNSEPHKLWYYINTAVKRKCYNLCKRRQILEQVELDEAWVQEEESADNVPIV